MPDPLSYLSGIGGVMSSVIPLLGSDKSREQFQYQLRLNEIQQRYARENRQQELYNQYRYQYNLPLLNKAGLRAAGYSVAGVEDGNVSSVSTPGTATPSAGAAPTGAADVSAALGVANLLQQLSLTQAQTEKTKAEAKGQKIQNDVDAASVDSDKLLRKSQSILADVQASNAEKYGDRRAKAETITAEIESQIKDMEFINGKALGTIEIRRLNLTCDTLLESLNYLKKQELIADATYDKLRQDITESKARVKNIDASTGKIESETEGIELDNDYKRQTLEARVNATKHQEVRALLDTYPKTVSEAAYALILNPDLYPALTKGMNSEQIRQLQEINKKLLDFKEISDVILPWR